MRSSSRLASVALLAVLGCVGATQKGSALRVEITAADRDADVWVDGEYVGQVSVLDSATLGNLVLAPGVHRVEVRKPGRFPVQRTVRIERKRAEPIVVVHAELLENPP